MQARYATHKIEKNKRNKPRKTIIRLYTNDDENSQLYQEKYRKTKRGIKYKINTIFFSFQTSHQHVENAFIIQ